MQAEAILKRKVENNPEQSNFRVQLAAHYLFTQQRAEYWIKPCRCLNDEKQYPDGHLAGGRFLLLPNPRLRGGAQAVRSGREGVSQGEGGVPKAAGGIAGHDRQECRRPINCWRRS